MAELEHWQMWRERCALARCTDTVRHDLRGFAFDRFRYQLFKLRVSLSAPPPEDAWHAFESYLALGRTRTTKAWKEWLFARGGTTPTLDCIQGGATLVMRDVVRNHLRSEHAPEWMLSLDRPIQKHPDSQSSPLTLEDLLPDNTNPINELEHKEYRRLAEQLFSLVVTDLSKRQQIVLAVHHAGKPLSHNSVTRAAACSKSALCETLHQTIQKMATALQKALPDESANARIEIAILILEKNLQQMQKILEIEHSDLFRYIKEDDTHAN